jgi:Papain family cysteine protease/Divergent InlB B-repeat domain
MDIMTKNNSASLHHPKASTSQRLLAAFTLLTTALTALSQDLTQAPISHPLMHLSAEEIQQSLFAHQKAPQYSASPALDGDVKGSLSLLSWLPCVPAERDQVHCGDCWQWASTGVMEIAHSVQNGVYDRLSVQYINSCATTPNCCQGGNLDAFVGFYASKGFAVPWANANAQFQSGTGSCSSAPCGNIATSPQYPITQIAAVSIATHAVGQAQAIANLKSALNQNQALYFSFRLDTDADWTDFDHFWDLQPESVLWTNFYCGQSYDPSGGGSHAVLCVGYNDDDPANPYWIMVNSWGVTSGRPNGLFRVSMNLNYDCSDNLGYTLMFETLNVQFATAALTVAASPTTGGTVGGSGRFAVGSQQQVAAIPNSGWLFSQWQDGTTQNPRTVTVPAAGTNCTAYFTQSPGLTLGDALNNTALAWSCSGNASWTAETTVSQDAVSAAQSGAISDNQQSVLQTTVTGPGTLTFWWKVSSEQDFDFVALTLNGVEKARLSGEVNWQQQTVAIPAGSQTLQWKYVKDASGSSGQDAAWLDQVTCTAGSPARPKVTSVTRSTSGLAKITLSGTAGATVGVEVSANLTHWTSLGTLTNITGTALYTDASATNYPIRFYRVFEAH